MVTSILRTATLYVLLIVVVRLLGKRQLGELEPSEFVITLLIADLASVPMEDLSAPILSGIVPIVTLLGLELLFSFLSYYSVTIRKILCSKPVILMENGKILHENLRKNRIAPDELTELLREKSILDLSTVKYAILETDGQISALLYEEHQPLSPHTVHANLSVYDLPYMIICDGKLMKENLRLSGKDQKWLEGILKKT